MFDVKKHFLALSFTSILTLGFCPIAAEPILAELRLGAKSTKIQLSQEEQLALNARWDLAYFLFQNQDYHAAAAEFEKIHKTFVDDATLLALLGSCYSMMGQWQAGENALLSAAEQNPNDEDINGLLGQFYSSVGQFEKSITYMEKSLSIAPEQDDLRAKLAELYLQQGKLGQAKNHFEMLLQSHGEVVFGNSELNFGLGRCLLKMHQPELALPYLTMAHQLAKSNPQITYSLGLCLFEQNYFAEAAEFLSQVKNQNWADDKLYVQTGEAHFLNRNWETAEKVWLEGLNRFPSSYPIMSRLIDYYIGTARPNRAAHVVAYGEKFNHGNPGNLLLQIQLKRKVSNYAAAWKALERLKRQACGKMSHEALWEEAQLDFETGKYGNCGKVLDYLIAKQHRNTEAYLMKAQMAAQNGDKGLAKIELLKARESNPYNLKVYLVAKAVFGTSGLESGEVLAGLAKPALTLTQP